jgi:hypothetical protein
MAASGIAITDVSEPAYLPQIRIIGFQNLNVPSAEIGKTKKN